LAHKALRPFTSNDKLPNDHGVNGEPAAVSLM
jgi:hypothetical protein